MRWRGSREGRAARPKVRALSGETTTVLADMAEEIARSPVLSGLGVRVRSLRGRFYLERSLGVGGTEDEVIARGRVTPLDGSDDFLLERGRRKGKGNWSEVARGPARALIAVVAGDTRGTFHGLVALDESLRREGQGGGSPQRDPEGEAWSVQELLHREFGVPLHVLVEPSEWYSYHRVPTLAEASEDRSRALVRSRATSFSGEGFAGTCPYARRDGRWDAYRIRPIEGRDIATAEAWLVKRKWKQWGA